jgi:branched-chain amino acid aminotransferase
MRSLDRLHRLQVTRDELYIADEVFFTGTAAEVTPAREIDDRLIGEGKPGPVTKALQSAYFDVIRGRNKKHVGWLDYLA